MTASLNDFLFRVKNSAGSAYTISCPFAYNENYYDDSHVKSTTNPNNWANSGSNWDLKYQRIDAGHAEGGRCETSSSTALTGNGKFSASIYIHSNVNPSDGVFTLAIVNEVTSQQTELDLIVINVGDNTSKSGAPGSAFSVPTSDISNQWIDVIMTKINGRCSTAIYSGGRVIFDPQGATHGCNIADGANKFVVNSRSRGGPTPYLSSFVSVSSASWEQM